MSKPSASSRAVGEAYEGGSNNDSPTYSSGNQAEFPIAGYKSSHRERIQAGVQKFKVHSAEAKEHHKSYDALDWLTVFLPCVGWLRTYNIKKYLLWDFIAGLSVGAMVVPQGMSYATIAGVPQVFGLYGAFMPPMFYSFFGSSKQLAVGPVAVTSLLIGNGMVKIIEGSVDIANPNKPLPFQEATQLIYNQNVIQLAFLVSVLYTAVGFLRLGWLMRLLSHSCISGFTSGAAITIGLSQFKYLLGYNVPRKNELQDQIQLLTEGAPAFKWQEWIMGTLVLSLLIVIKTLPKALPKAHWPRVLKPFGPLIACIIGVVAVYAGNLQDLGIKIVKTIPAGLPGATVNQWFPMPNFTQLITLALIVMLVDLLESTSIARALAIRNGYKVIWNREIIGLGIANFIGACFNSYTTTGSFSRSAVNNESGASTPLANFFTAWVVGFVLLFLTDVFAHLPFNVIGAIIIAGVASLFDWEHAVLVSKTRTLDLVVWIAAFLGVLFAGVEIGLAIAIGLGILIIFLESVFPGTHLLGRVPNSRAFGNVQQYKDSTQAPGVLVVSVDNSLYFANVQHVEEHIEKYTANYKKSQLSLPGGGSPLKAVVLDFSSIPRVDATGLHFLEEQVDHLGKGGVRLLIANPSPTVMRIFERVGFGYKLGYEHLFVSVYDAVQFAEEIQVRDKLGDVPEAAQKV